MIAKTLFKKYLLLFFIILTAQITLAPKELENEPEHHHKLIVNKPGVAVKVGGYLREEYIMAVGINSLLQNEINDYFTLFKHKGDLDVMCSLGRDPHKEPIAECFNKLTSFLYWRAEDVYYPPIPEPVTLYTTSPTTPTNISITLPPHQHHSKTPLFFLGESWLKFNTNTIFPDLNKRIDFFKIGFFSYQTGRGIALGYSSEGGVDYLGWKRDNPSLTAPVLSPGFILHGTIFNGLDYEFYFSKYRKGPDFPWHENGNVTNYRTDLTSFNEKNKWGQDLDSNIYASKLLFKTKTAHGLLLSAEPYVTYFYQKNHKLELPADSRVCLGSYGLMLEGSYNNFSWNVECAGQWGCLQIHEIDRNIVNLNKNNSGNDTTSIYTTFSEMNASTINVDNTPTAINASSPVNATDSILEYVNIPANRGPETNAATLVNTEGGYSPVGNIGGQPLYAVNNSDRTRKAFTLALKGFMAVGDCEYRFTKYPLKIALAGGYFSGDEYPLNNETSRAYKGFLPLRDFKYQGHYVTSLFALALRWFPRPSNPSHNGVFNGTNSFFAVNNTEATTALALIGTSFTVFPYSNEKKCSIKTNVSAFFSTNPLYKWEPKGTINDPILEQQRLINATTFNFQGWYSSEKASPYLGTEINTVISYWLNENCELLTRLAALIPGTLFKDISGQPNGGTLAKTTSNKYRAFSIGQDTCWGINLRLNYYF